MSWSPGKRIVLGFSVALVLLLVNAAVSWRNIAALAENDRWVAHSHEVIAELEGLILSVTTAQNSERGFALTGRQPFLEPYRAAVERTHARLARLKWLTSDNHAQQRQIASLDKEISAHLAVLDQVVSLIARNGASTVRDSQLVDQGQQLMAGIRTHAAAIRDAEDSLLRDRAKEAADRYDRALATVVIATVLGLVVTAAGFSILRRYVESQQTAAQNLQAAHDALEQRVRARTADLAQTNNMLEAEIAARQHVAEQLSLAHSELQASNARLGAILEGTTDQIAALDLEGRFIMFNQAYVLYFRALFGRDPVLGHRLEEDLPAEHENRDRKIQLWRRALAGQEFTVTEHFRAHELGPQFCEITFGSIRNLTGEMIGASHIGRYVTDRVLAEQRLAASAEQLRRSNRELEEFASVASHDLQEPLRKIQAFGDRLDAHCKGQLADQGRDYLNRMLQAAVRMRTLINDLLAFSRVNSRPKPFARVDLAQTAREVISDLEERIRQTGGQVVVEDLPVIEADALQMRQLLQNLIGNALKFHRPDQPPVVRVEASCMPPTGRSESQSDGAVCQLVVSDNGIGFDEKYLDRIFNVFQRLHGHAEYEGTGMGLAICRKIAERHQGTITAMSRPGDGASFVVVLPVSQNNNRGEKERGEAA